MSKESILLSCKKCSNCLTCDIEGDDITTCKNASVRHALEYLKEPCTEHPIIDKSMVILEVGKDAEYGKHYHNHRYLCGQCMSEIEKEINR
jgi:hypothetical protein